jgi:glycosylphosphatidylinositol deacylase
VLIVWIHNLSVHWLTPFSTHHNLLAVLPLVMVVEAMSTGNMAPRITGRARYTTNLLTFIFALYAAVYGVTYAYRLHHLLNVLAAWLFTLHLSQSGLSPFASLATTPAPTTSPASAKTPAIDASVKDEKKRP